MNQPNNISMQLDKAMSARGVSIPIEVRDPVFTLDDVSVFYGDYEAIRNVTLPIAKNEITAFIGPSGCGKSTLLRSFNRMNDLIPGARVEGVVAYHGTDIYGPDVDPIEVRRKVGMVFQKPNVFPKSIYDNVAYGPKVNGAKGNLDDLVEECGAGEFEMFFIYVDLLVSARFFCRDASCVCGMFHFVCCSFILITDPPVPVPRPPCADILKNNHTDAIRNSHFFHLCCALDCGDHGRRGRI